MTSQVFPLKKGNSHPIQEGDSAPVQEHGCTGHFSPLHNLSNNSRLGQHSVQTIDWTGANFEPGKIFAQNNPEHGLYGEFFTFQGKEKPQKTGPNLILNIH